MFLIGNNFLSCECKKVRWIIKFLIFLYLLFLFLFVCLMCLKFLRNRIILVSDIKLNLELFAFTSIFQIVRKLNFAKMLLMYPCHISYINKEVVDFRTTGFFIRDTACFHCDSMNSDS